MNEVLSPRPRPPVAPNAACVQGQGVMKWCRKSAKPDTALWRFGIKKKPLKTKYEQREKQKPNYTGYGSSTIGSYNGVFRVIR